MHSSAELGYAQARRQTASPRSIERGLLSSVASEIEAADPSNAEGYRLLAAAVARNTEIWTTLATDLAAPQNRCPDALKGQLIGLAAFVARHGRAVLAGEAEKGALVEINRNVAAGLAKAAALAEAA